MDVDEVLSAGTVYVQGNWRQLKRSMEAFSDVEQGRCLFFGDHLIQDVLAARRSRIDTVAIVEELGAEGSLNRHLNSQLWGSFFHEDGSVDTVWSALIRRCARLCIDAVNDLASVPINQPIVTFSGFFPAIPATLK